MSETSDDQHDDGTKNAALGESNSEDVREDLVGEIDADNNQTSDESTSGDSIDMRSSPDKDSLVNDPDELEEEASASPATDDEGSELESTDELEEEAVLRPQLMKAQNRKRMSLKKKLVLRPQLMKAQNRKVVMSLKKAVRRLQR